MGPIAPLARLHQCPPARVGRSIAGLEYHAHSTQPRRSFPQARPLDQFSSCLVLWLLPHKLQQAPCWGEAGPCGAPEPGWTVALPQAQQAELCPGEEKDLASGRGWLLSLWTKEGSEQQNPRRGWWAALA
ncbi:hypothetical protein KIL84_003769 [Mauremys mutica]|uniref:Uncharacterized protein n=1 Tax=Mauremys mutica TaxID=74926 RepID=A0A9D4ATT9_9SAUR|nr:hypothetical protein KIL84_003769 [Mauremys mutica]